MSEILSQKLLELQFETFYNAPFFWELRAKTHSTCNQPFVMSQGDTVSSHRLLATHQASLFLMQRNRMHSKISDLAGSSWKPRDFAGGSKQRANSGVR